MVGYLVSPFAHLIRLKTTKNKIPSQALFVESGAAVMVDGISAPLFIPKMLSLLERGSKSLSVLSLLLLTCCNLIDIGSRLRVVTTIFFCPCV